MEYIITKELRDTLLVILQILEENTTKNYHKYSDKYSDELLLENGKSIKLPFLKQMKEDLQGLEPVIRNKEYDSRIEEMIMVAKELGLF